MLSISGLSIAIWRLKPNDPNPFDELTYQYARSSKQIGSSPTALQKVSSEDSTNNNTERQDGQHSQQPEVSLIIFAHNDELNLPQALGNILPTGDSAVELIVVDSESDDYTAREAEKLGARVVRATQRPTHWQIQNWAFYQGAQSARGKYLLFTTANSIHSIENLKKAVRMMKQTGWHLSSALPFYSTKNTWEQLLAPFYALAFIFFAPFHVPTRQRVFSNSDYLLVHRDYYFEIGGHRCVSDHPAAHQALVRLTLEKNLHYGVLPQIHLFESKIPATYEDFVREWRAIFSDWLCHSDSKVAMFEVVAFLAAVSAGGFRYSSLVFAMISIVSLAVIYELQKRIGKFTVWGLVFWPFAAGTFLLVFALSFKDFLHRSEIENRLRGFLRSLWSLAFRKD